MRVGLLTQWYDPEPGPAALPGVLARELGRRGHEVQVLTGFPNYPTGRLAAGYRQTRRYDERADGVRVRRTPLFPAHGPSVVRRMVNYGSFGLSALVDGVDVFRGIDALWVNYSPITVAWPMWRARYQYGVPCVVHVLDLWPDTLLASGFGADGRVGSFIEGGLHRWCGAMYRAASSVAYISPGVGDVLAARGVPQEKLAYVPMWADEAVFRPSDVDLRRELDLPEDAVVLLYAGALGRAQGLDALVEACTKVADPRFRCIIAGSGVCESDLRAQADALGATNIVFLGRLPQERMTSLMATADITYVGLRPHELSGRTMPSKTQAALAAGCSVLVAAEGDVVDVVRESGAGFVAHPDQPRTIADAINEACRSGRQHLRRIGRLGRGYYDRTFSAARGVDHIESLLVRATTTKGRS